MEFYAKGEKKAKKTQPQTKKKKKGEKNSITCLTKDELGKHHCLHTYNVILCLCLAFVTTGRIDLSIIITVAYVILFHGITHYAYEN